MANVALSPSATAKLKSRESANKIRHGSPKLQEILRERCRQKMREKRGQLFNRGRFGLEINSKDVQDTLTEILRKEFNNLATTEWNQPSSPLSAIIDEPLDPEEALELENEIVNEEEQWILQEYEKMSQKELELLAQNADEQINEVLCPICQRCGLMDGINCVACKGCGFLLNTCTNVTQLGHLIGECVNVHSANCVEPPGFILLPENNNMCLYIVCHTCSTLAPIV